MSLETFHDLNIVEAAEKCGKFTILMAAFDVAGIKDILSGTEKFTLFAPIDQAFDDMPAEIHANLLEPENREKLVTILKYHVLAGSICSKEITDVDDIETLEGRKLTIMKSDGDIFINDAKVIMADINVSNGIIHVVDRVFIPE